MDKSLQETLNRARSYLEKKEFDEGLAFLESWSDDIPEIELMRRELEQAKIEEIDAILKDTAESQLREEWQTAFGLIRKAETLDSDDSKVRSAAERLRDAFVSERKREEVNKKIESAKALLERPGSIDELDIAVRLLEEVISGQPGEFDAESLLNDAQRMRSEFLRRVGQIATLEQTGEFEEALKEVKYLIMCNFSELDGENIYDVMGQLEMKVREFTEQKAAKYLKKAEDALTKDNNPQLAMRYIDTGLSLPAIPKIRKDAFTDLKVEVEIANDKFTEVDHQVKEACGLMDQQDYEKAIFKLEESLAKIPRHIEAQIFLKLAREGLRARILKDARMFIARVESGLNKKNVQQLQEDLLSVMDRLNVLGDKSGNKQKLPIEPNNAKTQLFISYSHFDKEYVNRLTTDLENEGMRVWVDEKEIDVGDSISRKIEEGISGCDFFCLVISTHSVNSKWVDREYRTALSGQLSPGTTPRILPLLIQDIEPPLLLKDIKYADFSRGYNSGLLNLLKAVKKE